jgi:hypothetical protein
LASLAYWYRKHHSGARRRGRGPGHGPVRTLLARGEDDLGAEDLEHLATLDRHARGHEDLDRVALDAGDGGEGDAGVARRRLDDGLARQERTVLLGLSIIALAMRSLTDPNGFCISSLARMRTSGLGDRFDTSTTGVLPIRSSSPNTRPTPDAFRLIRWFLSGIVSPQIGHTRPNVTFYP